MKNKQEEFINIIEYNTNVLASKYSLSESIHDDQYFTYGLRVGLQSLEEYLKNNYTFIKKNKIRKRKWVPKRKPLKRWSAKI